MSWLLLVLAGLLEVAWASVLPSTGGLTRPLPTSAFVVLLAASMFLLAKATDTIPLGTAYAVWVGIGAVGAALIGIVVRHEPASLPRLAFLALLVASVVGLKAVGGH
jgi:quaternary ammonium compound-resistance protein SugE